MIETIDTSRMRLTRIGPDDLPGLVHMYADPRVTATLGGMLDATAVSAYLDRQIAHWQDHGFGLWTMRDMSTGQFIGRGGLRHANIEGRLEVELSYGLITEYWGRGLATELARESLRIGFEVLGLSQIVCFTLPTNKPSQRVMQKAGFQYERDIIWAQLPHVLYRLSATVWQSARE
jgi:[ribosomal protein S5]-alanine N-acetyltransferase